MKAIVNADLLASELKKISPVIKKITTLPINSGILMEFSKNKLQLTGTDNNTTVISNISCECQKPFSLVISFADILNVCSKVSEPITIELKEKSIAINTVNSKFNFAILGEQEHFPSTPTEDYLFTVDVDGDFFYSLCNADSCKSSEQLRTAINTACIDFKKNRTVLIGTDGFVAYKKEIPALSKKEMQSQVTEQFVNMTKLFQDSKLSVSDKFIKAECGNTIVISTLQDSKYANYEVIIPTKILYNTIVDKNDFKRALSVVGVAANNISHICELNFTKEGEMIIKAQDINLDKYAETILKCTHSVDIEAIGVNGSQMLQILNLIDSDIINLCISASDKTIYIQPAESKDTLCLIQPLSLN